MSRKYMKLAAAFLCLTVITTANSSFASKVSFFVGYPQPVIQETYVPIVARPVYMPREYKRCYIERPVYMNGVIYPGQRICEHRLVPDQTVWMPGNGIDTYRVHRHHISYKHYY